MSPSPIIERRNSRIIAFENESNKLQSEEMEENQQGFSNNGDEVVKNNYSDLPSCDTTFCRTSKPNERWCRILLEKKQHFPPPPVTPPLFLGKKFFFGFSEKFSKFFFNEIDCKKFSNFFYNEVSSKKFFNSLKMTTKNFRNFFQ